MEYGRVSTLRGRLSAPSFRLCIGVIMQLETPIRLHFTSVRPARVLRDWPPTIIVLFSWNRQIARLCFTHNCESEIVGTRFTLTTSISPFAVRILMKRQRTTGENTSPWRRDKARGRA